jgi:hypothetical protein
MAAVPIEVTVHDDLAIARVELVYAQFATHDPIDQEQSRPQSAESKLEIYRRAEKPTGDAVGADGDEGETRTLKYQWSLAPLQLSIGTELRCHVEAADYRPGIGRTAAPRRIIVISGGELEARLATLQSQIVRHLERALAAQRAVREDVRRLEIRQDRLTAFAGQDRVAIQVAELNQRQVGRSLVELVNSAAGMVRALLTEIEMNRISAPDLSKAMEHLRAEIDQLSSGPLGVAESELVVARKAAEAVAARPPPATDDKLTPLNSADAQRWFDSLAKAGTAQDSVIAGLERLIRGLSGGTDLRRLAQQLAELRRDQIAHAQLVRDEIALETLPLLLSELSRDQRSKLESSAAGQAAIAARFDHIVRAIEQLAQEHSAEDAQAGEIAARAADLARSLAIAAAMQETARDLNGNRIGQALSREDQIAGDLQQVLDILRAGSAQPTEPINVQLRRAAERLAQLRSQAAALRQQIAQAERQSPSAAGPQRLSLLADGQQSLRHQAEQLAQQLQRLQAADAGQSTQNAADRLQTTPSSGRENSSAQRPVPSEQVIQAERDLEQAAQQLAAHRRQAEDDLALEFVRRFQAELGTMVERQRTVIENTAQLDANRTSDKRLDQDLAPSAARLAEEERNLANLATEHSELLTGLGAVRLSLEEASRRLGAAADRLAAQDTGPLAQQAERHALARLEAMLQAFSQTANEASQSAPAANAGTPAGQLPQRRPTFELLEVKMLRLLQVDLNERTRRVEDRLAELRQPSQDLRAELAREAQNLQAEQRRLVELVQELLSRDNSEGSE